MGKQKIHKGNYNFKATEKKWQKRWEEEKVFQATPDKRKKFFVNAPYPYMNAIPHIGHFYTYMRAEVLARYKRLRGYNVLFPQAWHCTGSPIVSAAKRVEEGEKKQIDSLKEQGFNNKEIEKLKNPEEWTKVFPAIWKEAFYRMGFSHDKRRGFITTELNPYYDKFVRWQFNKLKEAGLVEKGEHPVVWDPKTNMPVGDHDRIEGEGEVPQEFSLFKFSLKDGRKLISATLRPDTVKGITNLYANPKITYVIAEVNEEEWIIGKPMLEKLRNQGFNVSYVGDVNGKDLIGECVELFKGEKLLVLPADFLDQNYGTGIVHSVPSESADDLIALKDLQKNTELIKKYDLNEEEVKNIRPISIFKTPNIEGNTSQYFIDKYKVKNQNERDKLEKIKKELYTLTFNKSVFGPLYEKGFSKNLKGVSVSEGQEIIKSDLLKAGKIELFYELTGRVVSRSLTECVVKIVKDQWFIKYGDKDWKKKTHEALKDINIFPESAREQFFNTIDWLKDWACTREYGLGTRIPFDEKWLIESLSDSTIYMAYYTVSHVIEKIPVEKINDSFFDYIFLDKKPKPKIKNIEKLKKEFEYWYPFDIRNSGKDLIQNHLTFCLFNHVAIFPKKYWPKGFGVNGWVRVEGQKMSKSLGNMISLTEMAEKFGADVSRITILNGGEELDDPNWDSNFANMVDARLGSLYSFVIDNYGKGRTKKEPIDMWIEHELNNIIKETEEFMEKTLFRSAIQKSYFDLQLKLKWYMRRTAIPNKEVLKRIIETQTILLYPFTPFISEEMWRKIGKQKPVSLSVWPKIKKVAWKGNEELVKNILDDLNNVIKLLKSKEKEIKNAYIYVLPSEFNLLNKEANFFSRETGIDVKIFSVNDKNKYDPEGKSKKANPGKPGIYLE